MYRSPEVKPDPRRVLPAVDRLADAVAAERPELPDALRVDNVFGVIEQKHTAEVADVNHGGDDHQQGREKNRPPAPDMACVRSHGDVSLERPPFPGHVLPTATEPYSSGSPSPEASI